MPTAYPSHPHNNAIASSFRKESSYPESPYHFQDRRGCPALKPHPGNAGRTKKIDRAIVDRYPPTYRGVYDRFKLDSLNISFSAIYRYARRLRFNVSLARLAHVDDPDPRLDAGLADLIHKLIAQRLIDAADDIGTNAKTVHPLADAWRMAVVAGHTLARREEVLARILGRKQYPKEETAPPPRIPTDDLPPGIIEALKRLDPDSVA